MKGLSPLIAAVMLVGISIAVAGLVISNLIAFTKSAQESSQSKALDTVDCSGSLIQIDGVYLQNGTSGSARVVVKNIGVVDDLIIKEGVIFNITGGNFSANNLPIADFDGGDIEVLEFGPFNFRACDDFLRAVVATNCADGEARFVGKPVC